MACPVGCTPSTCPQICAPPISTRPNKSPPSHISSIKKGEPSGCAFNCDNYADFLENGLCRLQKAAMGCGAPAAGASSLPPGNPITGTGQIGLGGGLIPQAKNPTVTPAACKAQCASDCGPWYDPNGWGCQIDKVNCKCGGSAFDNCLPGIPIPCLYLVGGGALIGLAIFLKVR